MAKFNKGQKVVVVDNDKNYPTYHDWATDNNLSMSDPKIRELWAKYLSSDYNNCELGTFLTVVATGHHDVNRGITLYLCEDSEGDPVLIEEKGIDILVESNSLKWSDLKVGDVLRKKVSQFGGGYRHAMVIAIDDFTTCKHIQVAGDWLTDEELANGWEKEAEQFLED